MKRVRKGPVYDCISAVFVDDSGNSESETGVTQERLRPPLAAWLESQSQVRRELLNRFPGMAPKLTHSSTQTQCPPLSEYKQFDSVEVLYTDGWCVDARPPSRERWSHALSLVVCCPQVGGIRVQTRRPHCGGGF